jgi:DNA-binding NarL/FixJ family response regulator
MTCNLLLVDDHLLIRAGLRTWVAELPGYAVVGECNDYAQLLDRLPQLAPDIVLLDLKLCLGAGLRMLAQLKTLQPGCRLLIMASAYEPQLVLQVMQAGAQGFLLKRSNESELRQALDALRLGERYLSPNIAHDVLSAALALESTRQHSGMPPSNRLTARQLEILRLIARGKSTREMAAGLGLSVKTVETHRAQIMKRLQIFDVAGLVLYAVREGVISLDD